MFCKFFRLTNGDNIIANTHDPCTSYRDKEFIDILKPVSIGVMRYPKSGYLMEAHVFTPWIPGGVTTVVRLPITSIVAVVDAKENIAEQYVDYVNNGPSSQDSPENLNDAGEEEEMTFEEFLALANNDNEDDEDDDGSTTDYTLH